MYSMLYIIRDWTKNTKVINIINATFEIITFNIDLFQGNVVSHNLLVVSEKINPDQNKVMEVAVPLVTSTATMVAVSSHVLVVTTQVQVDRCHGGGWVHLTIAQQWWSQRSLFQVQFYKQNFRYKNTNKTFRYKNTSD